MARLRSAFSDDEQRHTRPRRPDHRFGRDHGNARRHRRRYCLGTNPSVSPAPDAAASQMIGIVPEGEPDAPKLWRSRLLHPAIGAAAPPWLLAPMDPGSDPCETAAEVSPVIPIGLWRNTV